MFGKQLNLHHQNQSRDGERGDTEMGRDAPVMSAAKKASESSSCSSGESGSSDSGGPWNKCPLSCLQANGGPQGATGELAVDSKIPHRGKAPLAPKCNKVHPAPYHNKHRPEHVKDRVLSGSTQGGPSKPTQSQDILKSENKMKHLFRKTNIPGIMEFGSPLRAETRDCSLGGATPVPSRSTFDIVSSDSEEEEEEDEEEEEEEEGKDDLSVSCWDTYRERDLISFPRAFCFTAHSRRCQHSLIQIPSLLLEPMSPPREALLPPSIVNRNFAFSRQHQQVQSSSRLPRLAFSHRANLCQRQSSVVSGDGDSVQSKTSATNTLQSSNECCGPSTCGQPDNLNVDDEADIQDCLAVQEGATAAQSLKDSNKETVCNQRLSNEEIKCRICYCDDSLSNNPLLSPCLCSGSVQFIHLHCLKRWIKEKIESGWGFNTVKRCEICKAALRVDRNMLDMRDYYRRGGREDQVSSLTPPPQIRLRVQIRRTGEWESPH